jgi:hypothetical protein
LGQGYVQGIGTSKLELRGKVGAKAGEAGVH